MRIVKIFVLLITLNFLSACSVLSPCKSKASGLGDNIPEATEGGPLKDINFAYDSYELDTRSRDILSMNSEWLQKNPGVSVKIEGHCDERGTAEYNLALGKNRSEAVKDYLRSLGVAEGRMSTVSYGEELPLENGHNESAWAVNRRAHFDVQ